MTSFNILLENIHAFVFDFDGVLTNNMVMTCQDGKEFVLCNRSDGLAFDVLNKLKKPAYILSTETNPVVKARAKKLKISSIQGVQNKESSIINLTEQYGYSLKNIMYVGNDINDYKVMQLCGYSACPSDSHPMIKSISNIILDSKGGGGVARELLEKELNINFYKVLYS